MQSNSTESTNVGTFVQDPNQANTYVKQPPEITDQKQISQQFHQDGRVDQNESVHAQMQQHCLDLTNVSGLNIVASCNFRFDYLSYPFPYQLNGLSYKP